MVILYCVHATIGALSRSLSEGKVPLLSSLPPPQSLLASASQPHPHNHHRQKQKLQRLPTHHPYLSLHYIGIRQHILRCCGHLCLSLAPLGDGDSRHRWIDTIGVTSQYEKKLQSHGEAITSPSSSSSSNFVQAIHALMPQHSLLYCTAYEPVLSVLFVQYSEAYRQ